MSEDSDAGSDWSAKSTVGMPQAEHGGSKSTTAGRGENDNPFE